jgi:undecaprenyl-diphosphatase
MEIAILDLIQKLRIPPLDTFFALFTRIGDHGELWLAIFLVLLMTKKYRKVALFALVALALELLLVEGLIKNIFVRPRPFMVNETIDLLIKTPSGYSFPSGHTASSFAFAAVLFFNKVPYRKTIMALAALMGFSRLYLYVHYPSDVLAGMVLGIFIGWVVVYIQKKYYGDIPVGGII